MPPSATKPATGQTSGQPSPYIPPSLSQLPSIQMSSLHRNLDAANLAIGRLNGMTSILPDASIFLFMHTRQEAVLSSQIEGTQSTLSDLLLFESKKKSGASIDDVKEVSNHVDAMKHGFEQIQSGIPVSLRLIREVHQILMSGSRGAPRQPGEFRRVQNWIGGARPETARFVPPSPERILDLMSELEQFIHAETPEIPELIKIGMVHARFEAIHPFLDGNGRVGRLLIVLLLHAQGILKNSALHLSLHFKEHRRDYYDLLQRVHEEDNWDSWLEFFLDGIAETASRMTDTGKKILDLFKKDQERIQSIGQSAASARRVYDLLQKTPFIAVPQAVSQIGISYPTANASIQRLEQIGILREVTGKKYRRVFVYDEYLRILSPDEPLTE